MPTIAPEVYTSMGLNSEEFELIVKLMGREPSLTELGMFAVMWSEHCGYKYSRPVLAYFKKYKEAMEGQGLENAGVIDLGDGLGVTMKVESHNHPSAVEPYQGAATGVGGIIRDILTMGARPVALLNSLRFGPVAEGEASPEIVVRNRYLFEHVVRGIAGYGNCVGVPTVAGEVNFHARYSGNPLVNAMCVGVMRIDEVTTAAATGVGNPVIYLGSATGKDGIHGATFASDTLGEDSEAKRPNVQIGDPFAEKLLIEATLEALATGAIVAIQDMGAAGLTCSTVEMASKGSVGMEIDLDLVPMRENDMSAYELMLSESQERMMAVATLGREQEVIDVFEKWGLKAVVVGHVNDNGILTVRRFGKVEAEVDPKHLTDFCPVYRSTIAAPDSFAAAASFDPHKLEEVDIRGALLKVLSHPDVASKRWVFQQYDQQVQTQTTLAFGEGDAAVLALRGTPKGIALKIDGNARHTFAHPYRGGQLAVCEAARNVACTGARPVAVTDGLNFGNPTLPHVYWQFSEAVKGIADAAEAMNTPVISGNVSFYNESEIGEVLPTPLIGMLGTLENASNRVPSRPSASCELVLISPECRDPHLGLGASTFLTAVHAIEDGYPVAPDVAYEAKLCEFLAHMAETGQILSAHDVSDGGIGATLAEIAMAGGSTTFDLSGETAASAIFGEFPGAVVVGVANGDAFIELAKSHGLSAETRGHYFRESGLNHLCLNWGEANWDWSCEELFSAYELAIPQAMTSV